MSQSPLNRREGRGILLRSAEMRWRGQLRDRSIRNLPNRFVQGKGTPHFRLNDPVQYFSQTRVSSTHRFHQLSSVHSHSVRSASIPIVGIVGGVGAGKSSVVASIRELHLDVIDADRIGHELLLQDNIRQSICGVFGKEMLDPTGQIDRERLAGKVFGTSDEQTNNRRRLNEILHPAIRRKVLQEIQQVPQEADAIILDAALLLEAGWADECNAIIFVDTPIELRQQRVAASRGWSPEELQKRELSQWSVAQKRAHAQYVVDNSGSATAAAEQMRTILNQIIHQKSQ